ncbi:MAG: hypothetical protein QOE90_3079 [Thermoplasmata archaeon]|nr:hypothetical protein [Thermoplasmata archaeon]
MATLSRLRRDGLDKSMLAGPAFRRAAPWLMLAAMAVALAVRLWPTIRFGVWGSDSGEYVYLSRRLLATGHVSFPYQGWGVAYPYFPGMFVVSAAVSAVVGVDVTHATLWTTPVLSALLPVLVGLLAYRVTSDPRVALVAAAFSAVTAAIAITTSHAMPGTLGQVLLLGMLAMLPESYRDRTHFAWLGLVGIALVLTHHLSTYFAIGVLAMIPVWRELTQDHYDVPRLRVEIPLVAGLLAFTLVWWLAVATPFRDQIVGDAIKLNPWLTAVAFLVALAALPALVVYKRARARWFLLPRHPGFPRQRRLIVGGFLLFTAVLIALVLVRLPGSDIKLTWATFWYALPLVAVLCFLPLGVSLARFYRQGTMIGGWLYAILASLAFAIATNSHVLFPFRHVDYMVEAMAVLVAIGVVAVYDELLVSRVPADRARWRVNLIAAFVALLVVSAALSNPPREVLGGFEEGISADELTAVQWMADHHDIIPAGSTIAADHRVSSLLWGLADLDATWDYTPQTYHADNLSAVRAELSDAQIPALGHAHGRVDYVFLSPQIEQGVTLLQWENSAPMSPAAVAKFDNSTLFSPVYNESGVQVFRINWTAFGQAP